jgi:hypothetical protein
MEWHYCPSCHSQRLRIGLIQDGRCNAVSLNFKGRSYHRPRAVSVPDIHSAQFAAYALDCFRQLRSTGSQTQKALTARGKVVKLTFGYGWLQRIVGNFQFQIVSKMLSYPMLSSHGSHFYLYHRGRIGPRGRSDWAVACLFNL